MSADLFAEFDAPPKAAHARHQSQPAGSLSFAPAGPSTTQTSPWAATQLQPAQQPASLSAWGALADLQPAQQPAATQEADDDDGWGDFEVAETANPPAPAKVPAPQPLSRPVGPSSFQSQGPGPQKLVRASTFDLMTNSLVGLDTSTPPPQASKGPQRSGGALGILEESPQKPAPAPASRQANPDPNVLFDADDFDGQSPEDDDEDDDDDFGDFETVGVAPRVSAPAQAPTPAWAPAPVPAAAPPPAQYDSALDLLSGLDIDGPPPPYSPPQTSPPLKDRSPFPGLAVTTPPIGSSDQHQEPKGKTRETPVTAWPSYENNFGQKKQESCGQWGSFGATASSSKPPAAKAVDADWDWESVEPAKPSGNPKGGAGKPAPKPASLDSSWDWDPVAPTNPAAQTKQSAKGASAASAALDSSWDWDSTDAQPEVRSTTAKDDIPPINIPPPSVLMSVFPQLIGEADGALFKPVNGKNNSIKNRVLTDPKTIEYLQGYLALAAVACRIIAGRKLRWHRDKFLSQSMSISAAGSKGMKLAGVDKAQTKREDREAGDVVAAWKEYVGRLRSAVAAANSAAQGRGEQLQVPEMSETMPVQTAKGVPTAAKACLICGLKRDERLAKVDHQVEDSFGEWWVEHWGHVTCKRFWLQHEATLRQR